MDETLPDGGAAHAATIASSPGDAAASADSAASGPSPADSLALSPGDHIGRYAVEAMLGAGAMGVVVLARDPSLERKVALKIVHGDQTGTTLGRQRLLREAQAMAQLSHPNVVTVYEVGTVDDRVFIAMEYVSGWTLAAWLAAERRSLRAIVETFTAAGRGLAAAHAVGLVHRDFKPANVLVSRDGRVRVADFGLATASTAMPRASSQAEPPSRNSPLHISMTQTGAVLGTPAYMAPEQHRSEPADARADQFAFCVALHEALYGCLPFEGEGYIAYSEAVIAGRVREAPAGRAVPARLRRVVLRGLASDPAARYASMNELLRELERSVARRRPWLLAAGGGGAAAAAIAAALFVQDDTPRADPCLAAEQGASRLWDAGARTRLEQAFVASKARDATTTFARLDKAFTARTRELAGVRRDACEANLRREQSDELFDRRMACLDRRGMEMTQLIEVLVTSPDQTMIDRAVQAATSLPRVDVCNDRDALMAATPIPADVDLRKRIDALEQRLARAQALEKAGRWTEAFELAKQVVPEADATGFAPLRARARLEMALAQNSLGKHEDTAATLRDATGFAASARDHFLEARIWILLYGTLGYQLSRPAEAATLEPAAVAAIERAAAPTELRGHLANARGAIALGTGDYLLSAKHFADAEKNLTEALGAQHVQIANVAHNAGLALSYAGKHDEALVALERAQMLRRELLGAEHPMIATSMTAIAGVLDTMDKRTEALDMFQQAYALRQKILPAGHPSLGSASSSIGVVLDNLERSAEALPHHQRAVAIYEALPDSQVQLSMALSNLAVSLAKLEKHADAVAVYERALASKEKILGADHPTVAHTLCAMGESAFVLGGIKRQRPLCGRALAILEKRFGPEHVEVAAPLASLAASSVKSGLARDALPLIERARAIHEKAGNSDSIMYGNVTALHGEALTQLGRTKDAVPLLEQGLTLLRKHRGTTKDIARIEAVLEAARAGRKR